MTKAEKAAEDAAAEKAADAARIAHARSKESREMDGQGKTGWFPAFTPRQKPWMKKVNRDAPPVRLRALHVRSVKDGCITIHPDDLNMADGNPSFLREGLRTALSRRDKVFGVPIFVVDDPAPPIPGVRHGAEVSVRNADWDAARLYYAKKSAEDARRMNSHVLRENAKANAERKIDPQGLAPSMPTMPDPTYG